MAFGASSGIPIGGVPRVNLMPKAEVERRQRREIIVRWGWALAAALLVVLGVSAGAWWVQATATQRLAEENARTGELLSQVAALSPVQSKLALEAGLEDFRSQAMGADLRWADLTATMINALPDNVTITGFELTPGRLPVGDDRTTEAGATGSITLASPTALEIVELIRKLRDADGVYRAEVWELASGTGVYNYLLSVVYDQTAYTGKYAQEVAE